MKRKMITLLFTAVIAGTFLGCSSSSSTNNSSSNTQVESSVSAQTAVEEASILADTASNTLEEAPTNAVGSADISPEESQEEIIIDDLEEEDAEITLSEHQITLMEGIAQWAYKYHYGTDTKESGTLTAADLTENDRANLLYYYQYHADDARLTNSGEYNTISYEDLSEMAAGVTTASDPYADITALLTYDIYPLATQNGDEVQINASGDFGALIGFYCFDGIFEGVESGRIKITGVVKDESLAEIGSYTAWFGTSKDGAMESYPFDEFEIIFN